MPQMNLADQERMRRQVQAMLAQQQPQGGVNTTQKAMTPEEQAILDAQAAKSTEGMAEQLAAQQKYADGLRGTAVPEGRTAGNIYMAANPLEGLATIAQRGVGEYANYKLGDKYKAYDEAKTDAKTAGFELARQAEALKNRQAVEAARLKEAGLNTRNDATITGAGERNDATNSSADARNEANIAARKAASRNVIELVSNTDNKDVVAVYELEGKYYDPFTDEQVSGAGRSERVKNTRSSGSRFTRSKSKDPFGNDVVTIFDKSDGSEEIATFGNGDPYSREEAKRRGGERAAQAGSEATAEAAGEANVKASEKAYEETFAIRGVLQELDKGLDALTVDGANTGWLADKLPNVREGAIKLQAAKDQMALYEIGKYTFGSLSEAEGNWLKDVVIPTTLDEDELIPWMERKREGMARMLKVKEFEQEMRDAGLKPTQKEIDGILYKGGFSFSDGPAR